MNDIFENTETMKENEHPRFYTAESVMRGHPDKLCDLIADSVLDACLQHDPASRVACEVMATHGHIIVAGEITTSAKPDVFNIVRDTLRDVGYDPKAYQIDCYIHDQSPDIAGAVEPELAEGEDEDTLGAGDQGVMVGYACNETPEYLPMPVVAAQRLVTLLEISRMTGVIPDIGPDGKVQVTMEYNGDTPVRITTVIVSVQHKEDTDINKLADLLDEYVFPLAFDGMPADDAEIILNPSGKFVQGGPDADTGLTGRKLMVDSYGTFAPHGGGAFSGKDSLQEIAKHLQANSIPYSDETGWNKNTVHRIVKNPAYCGKDRYPPIVEYTLFQKAQVLCQRKAPTYTEALKDIRGDIICPDCDSRLEWQTKGHRWRCRHCAAFSVQIAPDILLQSIATTMKRLQDNPDSINDQPLSHNTVSIEAEKQQAEIDEMLSAGEFDAASLIQSVLSRADTQYLCCTAGNSDPMTLRIKEALAAAPPCDTFDSKLYHTIADKIVLHRTTSIQLKLINGMVV